ncbi:MAG: type I 3-dehydroquinate dehydratase [Ruminococcaceae bacterium]|nr:type I 3-dehydroquinate dehydratase [Oscillospiraceae bacterium]
MTNKPTFLHQNKPMITAMVQATNPDDLIQLVRTAAFDGADAYGFQCEKLERKYQNEETVRNIFDAMAPRPIYATNYRFFSNEGKSDDEIAKGLLWLCDMGATLIDVLGDLYCPTQYEITKDHAAIEKQKALIAEIHAKGCEVLMSSHTLTFMSTEEVLAIAKEHQSRGADISKIVTAANSEEEELENLKTATVLRRELDIPFLFLSGGTHNHLHRAFGPMFGSCMWLTVPLYDQCATPSQPLLRSIRAIRDNFDC